MAFNAVSNSDSRINISIAPPHPISKDAPGSETPIPLSPQWLLPKPGWNEPGIGIGEHHAAPSSAMRNHVESNKSSGNGDKILDPQKKKGAFTPSLFDMQNGQHDRWQDEEREINSTVCNDHWRGGDRERGDPSKMDPKENLLVRNFGNICRASSWKNDLSNRDSNYEQRRESKWNTSWGPNNKDIEGLNEKSISLGKDGDVADKGQVNLTNHRKDDREGGSFRPWRSSSSQIRQNGDPPYFQSPNKQGPSFSHGRGRVGNAPSTFSLGRGKFGLSESSINNSGAHLIGASSNKGGTDQVEASMLRYSRMKLLDIYRMIDLKSYGNLGEGMILVPSLMKDKPLEPMAFCAPHAEEKELLSRIDRGDIVSSSGPHVSKDESFVRNSSDVSHSRQTELGKRGSLDAIDNFKTEAMEVNLPHDYYSPEFPEEKQHLSRSGSKMEIGRQKTYAASRSKKEGFVDDNYYRNNYSRPFSEALIVQEKDVCNGEITWSATSLGDSQQRFLNDYKEITTEVGEIVGLELQKDMSDNWGNHLAKPSYPKDERIWPPNEDPILKLQSPSLSSRDLEMRMLAQIPPENLILHYKDPQGEIQGPFSGSDIIAWFEAGFFGLDLEVRLPSTSNDSPFLLLGDVMPHLCAKERTPPGFNPPRETETIAAARKTNFSSFQNVQTGFNNIDLIRNEVGFQQGSVTEAENRFVESLMPSNIGNTCFEGTSFLTGLQGYKDLGAGSRPSSLGDHGKMSLLDKRMALERQSRVPNSYEYLSGRDGASMDPSARIVHQSLASPIVPSSATDSSHFHQPQNAGLKGLQDHSLSGVDTNWSNFHIPDTPLVFNEAENFPSSEPVHLLQHRLSSQHQGPLTNLFAQNLDNLPANATLDDFLSAGMLQDPKLLSTLQSQSQVSFSSLRPQSVDSLPSNLTHGKLLSGLIHDSRLLNALQQQYLLQLRSQTAAMSHQFSPLDKLLLLKQQQKQEELQQLLLRQQQLFSQAVAERQPQTQTCIGDMTLASLQAAAMQNANASSNPLHKPLSEVVGAGSNSSLVGLSDEQIASTLNLPMSLDSSFGHKSTSEASLQLPGQIHGDNNQQKSWPPPIHGQIEIAHKKHSPASGHAKHTSSVEAFEGSLQEALNVTIDKASLSKMISGNSLRDDEKIVASVVGPTAETAAFLNISGEACRKDLPMIRSADNVETQGSLDKRLNQEESANLICEDKEEETREGKTSEKKSRKQKTLNSSFGNEQANGSQISSLQRKQSVAKQQQHIDSTEFGLPTDILEIRGSDSTTKLENLQSLPEGGSLPESSSTYHIEKMEEKGDTGHDEAFPPENTKAWSELQAWKGALSVKAKSLLEIQQEEQKKTQTRTAVSGVSTSVSSANLSTPWDGIMASVEVKASHDTSGDAGGAKESKGRERSYRFTSQKSQNDLSVNGAGPKSTETEMELPKSISSLSQQDTSTYIQSVDDGNFIEAKETRRSRKKSAKAKTKSKTSVTISSGLPANSSTSEKGRSSQTAQEKEILPAIPSGPSFGEFFPWKEDTTNTSTATAWSVDSMKLEKPTSLRDILKEQEKKVSTTQNQNEMPAPSKSRPNQTSCGSWSLSASLSKTASPIKINSINSSQTISKGNEDLFCGPSEHLKQEGKQIDYPRLANQVIVGTKKTSVKGTPDMPMTQEKYSILKGDQSSLSSYTIQTESSMKVKGEAMNKLSEAMDFRNWCQKECLRLFGSTDTSVLEFCLKQSRSEAQTILIENLGSLDPDHTFIDKFLNYMDLLPQDVLDVALRSPIYGKVPDAKSTSNKLNNGNSNRDKTPGLDKSTKGGGKKKSKKGKKVSPSVLGFNVVSNRIMMGEIQTVDE